MPASRNSATAWAKSVTEANNRAGLKCVQTEDDLIVAGTLYREDVETGPVGVEQLSGNCLASDLKHDERDHTVGIVAGIHSTSRPPAGAIGRCGEDSPM